MNISTFMFVFTHEFITYALVIEFTTLKEEGVKCGNMCARGTIYINTCTRVIAHNQQQQMRKTWVSLLLESELDVLAAPPECLYSTCP